MRGEDSDKGGEEVKIVARLSDVLERLARRGISEDDVVIDTASIRILRDDDGADDEDDEED